MSINWKPFVETVSKNQSFLLTSHMRPDCDALGSELGMAHALRSLGKKVQIVNGDEVPPHITFIDPEQEIQVFRDQPLGDIDVLMVLDTSAWSQLGPMADVVREFTGTKVIVDHHKSSDDLGAVEFKNTAAESTGRLVLEAAEALGVTVTSAMAAALFAAIATDTGWFRFSSVSDETFAATARLLAAGAKPPDTFAALYEQHSFARLLLQGQIMRNAQRDVDGRLIYSAVSLQDLAQTGAEATDTEDVINRLMSVAGVEVGLLFSELDPALTKVSLRSRSDFDVRKVAEQFGGGGHTAAAGLKFSGTLAQAQTSVVDAVRTELEQ